MTFDSAAVVAVAALVTPLVVHLMRLPVPSVAAEILIGALIGPQLLGWARPDQTVQVLSLLGVGFLLFLAGLEIDLSRFRGRALLLTAGAFGTSVLLGLSLGVALGGAGLVKSPMLIAVVLASTSLGIVLPILQDAHQLDTPLGQLVTMGATLAEVLPIIALSILFATDPRGLGPPMGLLAVFVALAIVLGAFLTVLRRNTKLTTALAALQDTTAEIRVRAAIALLILLAAAATSLGLEAILGAFLAGAIVRRVDPAIAASPNPLRTKLQAVGSGVFIPFFFIGTGLSLDLRGLIAHGRTVLLVPLFLVALLLARTLPALLYRPLLSDWRRSTAAGLLQATSLSIPTIAGAVGLKLDLIRPDTYAALIGAGLTSVILFPVIAQRLLHRPGVAHSAGSTRS